MSTVIARFQQGPRIGLGRTWLTTVAAIVTVALLVRIGLVLITPHFRLIYDSADYQLHGAAISLGFGYPVTQLATPGTPSAFRPPGYPYLLGALYWVLGIHPNLGRLFGAVLGAGSAGLTAQLARALWGPRAGTAAGLVAALFPPLVELNGSLLSESLFVPLALGLALVLVTLGRTPAPSWRWGLAGALAAGAALTRSSGVLLLVPVLGLAFAAAPGWSVRLRRAGAAVLAVAVVLIPWSVRNASTFGSFVPFSTQTGVTLAGVYDTEAAAPGPRQGIWRDFPLETPDLDQALIALYRRTGGIDEAQLDARLTSLAVRYMSRHPGYVARVGVWNALRILDLGHGHGETTARAFAEMNVPGGLRRLTSLSLWVLGAAALAAGALVVRDRRRRGRGTATRYAVWAIPWLIGLSTVLVDGSPRYGTVVYPFLIVLAVRPLGRSASLIAPA